MVNNKEVLKYVGRTLKREGMTKDNKPYKVFKINFEQKDRDYARGFDCFDPLKGEGSVQPNSMVEGKWYEIEYYFGKPFDTQYGSTVTPRTVVKLTESTEDKSTDGNALPQPQTSVQPPPQPVNQQGLNVTEEIVSDDKINSLVTAYERSVKPEDINQCHFIGTCMMVLHPNNKEIEKLAKAFIENIVVKK